MRKVDLWKTGYVNTYLMSMPQGGGGIGSSAGGGGGDPAGPPGDSSAAGGGGYTGFWPFGDDTPFMVANAGWEQNEDGTWTNKYTGVTISGGPGIGNTVVTPGDGDEEGGGGAPGINTLNTPFPPPPGINAPGQEVPTEEDIQQGYQDAIQKGKDLIAKLGDPNFMNLISSAMAMKFQPPPGWEQAFNVGQPGQPNQFAQYQPQGFNAASYSNPYAQLLQQNVANTPTGSVPTGGIQYGGHYGNTGS